MTAVPAEEPADEPQDEPADPAAPAIEQRAADNRGAHAHRRERRANGRVGDRRPSWQDRRVSLTTYRIDRDGADRTTSGRRVKVVQIVAAREYIPEDPTDIDGCKSDADESCDRVH